MQRLHQAVTAGKVVALGDVTGAVSAPGGLSEEDLRATSVRELARLHDEIDPDDLLTIECDVLIPAALGGVINAANANRISAGIVVEAANQPVVGGADAVLESRGTVVVPDILANAGGVLGSYFEWTQNIQEFRWPISRFRDELDARMQVAFDVVQSASVRHGCNLRDAAYVVAVARVADSFETRGRVI